jgi:hypothetical protein
MSYRIAGIDVHKKMLAVVVTDVEVEGEYELARRQFGTTPDHLRWLSEWFVEQGVGEVVMESTAQYWKLVWGPLELYWQPSCKKREGVSPMSGTQVSNSVRPMHLFGHNRDHDYYFELPCELERDPQSRQY